MNGRAPRCAGARHMLERLAKLEARQHVGLVRACRNDYHPPECSGMNPTCIR